MAKSLKLEELEVYKVAMEIGEIVWRVVDKWDYFPKKKRWVLNLLKRQIL